ncbi:O-methyltransferase [Spirilliplanes yamanashiensis]|uniref:O-methyltransferase n=1 Tax=Spirilliplanes yamanashiensis TaxID=42233 RepID=A0A8J3Y3E6_9ACTN|nr:O-methyltransferase [Spirilliplanes yamanashiensis]MDP9814143.1 caffeoyl-CoA O-methyltransferase [Spirilliplanes yamanashiensis]GIJ00875.1 O-methyltransferase [Spirilliplanes yamanashiensis]
MTFKPLPLTPDLHAYLLAHGTPPDEVAADLIAETRALLPDNAGMQVAPEQAAFLTLLAKVQGTGYAVEVGTFTGLSSLAIARGLRDGGRLTCFDISTEFTDVARRYWARAGVDDRIDLRIGAAADGLRALPAGEHIDLAFIDADKENYHVYWAELVPRLRPGGLVLVDNVLWSGRVLDPQRESDHAIVAFNDMVVGDDRVEVVMLPVADGLTIARKR